jgi:hypothetical protein
MENGGGRILFGWLLAILMLGSSWMVLGFPWQPAAPSPSTPTGARRWHYPYFGGGHGGWIGRGFGWGSFGELGGGDGFRGGGPGAGK